MKLSAFVLVTRCGYLDLGGNQINGCMEKAWTFKWFGPELTHTCGKGQKESKEAAVGLGQRKG